MLCRLKRTRRGPARGWAGAAQADAAQAAPPLGGMGGGGGPRRGAALLCPGPGSGSAVPLLRAGDVAHHGHQPGPCCCSSVQQLRAAPLGAGYAAAGATRSPFPADAATLAGLLHITLRYAALAHSRVPAAHNDWLCAGAAAAAEGHNSPACCRYPLRLSSAALPDLEPTRRSLRSAPPSAAGRSKRGQQPGAGAAAVPGVMERGHRREPVSDRVPPAGGRRERPSGNARPAAARRTGWGWGAGAASANGGAVGTRKGWPRRGHWLGRLVSERG